MYTIDTTDNESPITWFNLSCSPFMNNSPMLLFSPSLSVEMLSPPSINENDDEYILWDMPDVNKHPKHPKHPKHLIRDDYLSQILNHLYDMIRNGVVIMYHQSSIISSIDINNMIINVINNDISCNKLDKLYIEQFRKKLIDRSHSIYQSLSAVNEDSVFAE